MTLDIDHRHAVAPRRGPDPACGAMFARDAKRRASDVPAYEIGGARTTADMADVLGMAIELSRRDARAKALRLQAFTLAPLIVAGHELELLDRVACVLAAAIGHARPGSTIRCEAGYWGRRTGLRIGFSVDAPILHAVQGLRGRCGLMPTRSSESAVRPRSGPAADHAYWLWFRSPSSMESRPERSVGYR
ncbi:MAG: hypothetical protein ACK4TL_04575 [Hyphomicrobiaceae bacterium]